MRDVESVCSVPVHAPPVLLGEGPHEFQGLRHVERVDAFGQGEGLLQERAVGVGPLASEGGIHDHGVRPIVHIRDFGEMELHLGTEQFGIRPRDPQGLLGGVVPDDHPGVEHPRSDREHARAASQIDDLQPLYVPVAVRLEEHVGGHGRRGHVLLHGDLRLLERPDLLQRDLELPLPHRTRILSDRIWLSLSLIRIIPVFLRFPYPNDIVYV